MLIKTLFTPYLIKSQEEIISKFNEKIKIIPVVDKTFKFIDYFELKHGIHLPLAQPDLSQKSLNI